ncbi:helix-turn-helix domain-containing protein [Cellulosimicrobium cellulans]|uniref:helix-turn-helix domain-containing protein n=1 Tax=Cellulosimicrobium cellulans TaxID=1710 RepID=UPI003664FD27
MTEARRRTAAAAAAGDWPPELAALGSRVTEERKRRGLTQEELAELAGLSRPTISKIERGVQDVGVVVLCKIARVLGVAAASLLDGADLA